VNIKSISLLLPLFITNFTATQSVENKTEYEVAIHKKALPPAIKKQYQLSLQKDALILSESLRRRYKPDACSCFLTPPVTYLCISNKKEYLADLQQLQSK